MRLEKAARHGELGEDKKAVLAAEAAYWLEANEESFKDSPMRPHGTV
jgi:hypothetical protein